MINLNTTTDNLQPDQIAAILNASGSGPQWTARCPAHDDRRASLSIGTGENGKVLLHCHAGCEPSAIFDAMGLKTRGNRPATKTKTKKKHPTADRAIEAATWSVHQHDAGATLTKVYNYGDSVKVARYSNKEFRPVHRVTDGWIVGRPTSYPIYRLDDINMAGADTFVFFTEGEKDADNLHEAGLIGTTIAGGADGIVRNLKAADLSALSNRDVVLLPDNDKVGQSCMEDVAAILKPVTASVRILNLPDLPDKGDVTDWLDAGGDPEDLVRLAEDTPVVRASRTPIAVQRASEGKPFQLSDLGNAERFEAAHGDQFRYVFLSDKGGRFYHWTGTRWQLDTAGAAKRAACRTARDITREANVTENHDKRKEILKHGIKAESARGIHAILDLASSQPKIGITNDQLDRDPWLFNTLTGTLDLQTGQLRPHDQRDLITKLSPVAYDPDAQCPTYDRFLEDITLHRPDLAEYLERTLGYCLTGETYHHDLPIAYGGGANGKSTLFDLALFIAGDYGTPAPESLLTVSKRDEHPTEIANLQGKRLVVASETPEGAALRINLIKKLTGDKEMIGRFMRQDLFKFQRTHKLILQTNNRPRISEQSNATWRRIKLIPFDLQVPESQQDAELPEKLKDEAPGILARWVRAAMRWQADDFDLAVPDVVRSMTETYREDENPIAEWLESRIEVTGSEIHHIKRTDLYSNYKLWSEVQGQRTLNSRMFYDRIRKMSNVLDKPKKIDGQTTHVFLGLRFIPG